ncbi:proline-rich receptor-like protein kinase PERK9 [Hyposmocoma kahamanoa]|uniref:proline-rich receptor-like protein kinase PERK9 n=1 Tax=Hyposmocoma kahamanoa TaxID=1477025 RepID=UPI000E6D7238|nr:proline-rich receptor-like protein kinase PERK9 [Hyposmocoma kahamanoa]
MPGPSTAPQQTQPKRPALNPLPREPRHRSPITPPSSAGLSVSAFESVPSAPPKPPTKGSKAASTSVPVSSAAARPQPPTARQSRAEPAATTSASATSRGAAIVAAAERPAKSGPPPRPATRTTTASARINPAPPRATAAGMPARPRPTVSTRAATAATRTTATAAVNNTAEQRQPRSQASPPLTRTRATEARSPPPLFAAVAARSPTPPSASAAPSMPGLGSPMDTAPTPRTPTPEPPTPETTPPNRSTAPTAPPAEKRPRYPPLIVEHLPNWAHHFRELKSKLSRAPNARPYGRGVRFLPRDEVEYRLVQRYLTTLEREEGISWFAYSLPAERSLKVAIRGLPAETDTEDILQELRELGFAPDSSGTQTPSPGYMR